jgi:hypothetical protein
MPVEGDPNKVLGLPDEEFFRWRAGAREVLAEGGDTRLAALYEASGNELVARAVRAWSAGHEQ